MLTFNFSPFPLLETERLTLRKINIVDAEEIFTLISDDRVNEFIDRPKAQSEEDARNFINQIRSRGSNNELLYWAITQKKDSKLIGTIVYWNLDKENYSAELGFELLPDFQGQGLMREALLKVIEYGFKGLGLKTIIALPEEGNEKSILLLERANFSKEETFEATSTETNNSIKTTKFILKGSDVNS